MFSAIADPTLVMRSDNHGGTRPPCKGKSANPDRFISDSFYSPKLKAYCRTYGIQQKPSTLIPYLQYYLNMVNATSAQIARFADMFSAMGTEARLRIMQLLMTA